MASLQQQLKQIEQKLQKSINDSLQKEVSEVAKKEISASVDKMVYQKYDPTKYWRRKYDNLGLADESQINTTLVNPGELVITDDAPFNPYNDKGTYEPTGSEPEKELGEIDMSKSLAYNIEYGWGFQSTAYSRPRPFMEDAKKELSNGKAKDALLKGLRRNGLDVE